MIPFTDFRRLILAASECSALDQYMAECGGSVPLDDPSEAISLLDTLYRIGHDGLTIKRISEACSIPVRQIAIRYGIPTRTLENWSSGDRKPSDWQLSLIAYAVISDRGRTRADQ